MMMTGGQALARQLQRQGITEVFGIPGIQLDWAVDGLRELSNSIRFIVPRHEQSTSYMADGYARTTGRIGTCMIVPGPGLLNAMAGLATAYACNSRVLCIAGSIPSPAIGKGFGMLHEVERQSDILGTVTKWHSAATATGGIPDLVREAVRQLKGGRPRPVGIEVAPDLLKASAEMDLLTPFADDNGLIGADPAAIDKAAALLELSRFPVIYVGGGVLAAGASQALQDVAERLEAPVVMSENGRGALSDRHPLALTSLAGRAVFPHADVVLVVGSRYVDNALGTPAWTSDRIRTIFLNVEPAAWAPPRAADIKIHADARLGLQALAATLPRRQNPMALELDKVRAWAEQQSNELEPQTSWVRALRAAIPEDGILVSELTQVGYCTRFMYPVYGPNTFILPGYQGTLGYGFPTALGAAVGNPRRPVVSITGDGGFGWNMQELATARKYNLRVVTVVFNDHHFGNVRTMQRQQFGQDQTYGVDLFNPRFDKLAEAFDIPFARVNRPDNLEGVLREALNAGGPSLIEAEVAEMPSPWHLMRLKVPPFAKAGRPAPPNPLGDPDGTTTGHRK
jgi:acetolactate synthase-1/2/3 large subunit